MEKLHTFEILTPNSQIFVRYGPRVYAVLFEQGMLRIVGAVNVKFLFEQGIDCGVEVKGEAGRSANTQASVEIKAAWAGDKQVNLTAAQLEGFVALWIVQVTCTRHCVILRHDQEYSGLLNGKT